MWRFSQVFSRQGHICIARAFKPSYATIKAEAINNSTVLLGTLHWGYTKLIWYVYTFPVNLELTDELYFLMSYQKIPLVLWCLTQKANQNETPRNAIRHQILFHIYMTPNIITLFVSYSY